MTFCDFNNSGKIDVHHNNPGRNELLEENHYYPFGMRMKQPSIVLSMPNPYCYNGKELNEDFGLNLYDYGARWYDASIGRWHSVDLLAEKYTPFSGYNYVLNNPLRFIDPDGRSVENTIYIDTETGKELHRTKDNLDNAVVFVSDAKKFKKTMAAHGKAKITGTASAIELRTLGQAYYTNALGNLYDYGQSVKHVSTPDEDGNYKVGDFKTSATNGEWSPEHVVKLVPDANGNMSVEWSSLADHESPILNAGGWAWNPEKGEAMAHTHPSNPGLEMYEKEANGFVPVPNSKEGGPVSYADAYQYRSAHSNYMKNIPHKTFNVAVSKNYFRFYKGNAEKAINVDKSFLYGRY